VLDLGHNRLATLPGAVPRLTGLDFLKVDGNRLAALPDAVAGLTGLSWLDARHNRLKVLPAELRGMGRLDCLDLAGNALATVPDSIGALGGLSILDLSRNRLATLPDAIGELSRLKVLRLADNQLTALPPAVCRLAGLEALVVSRNRLTTVPEAIGALTKLVKLDLSDNLLDGAPGVLADLPELAVLELDGNPGYPTRPPPYEMPETAGRSELFQLVVSGLMGWAGSQGGKDGLDANSYAVSQLRRLAGAERTMAEDLAIGLLSTGNTAGARALVEARCTRAVSVLRALATSTTEAPERRLGAARGLAAFDPAAGRAVAIEILRDTTLHWRVRTEAVRILAAHRGGDAEAALAEAASDPVENVRSAAKGVLRAPGSWG
jgi:hypothetical protein